MKVKKKYGLLLIIFCVNILSSQTNLDIFKSNMKKCNLNWLDENHKSDSFEFILDSMSNHKERIVFRIIDDISILDEEININEYITRTYYNNVEIYSDPYSVKTEKTNLLLYIFKIKISDDNIKNDKHTIKSLCGQHYIISYFSKFGIGRETFYKFEMLNSELEKILCL